MRFVSIITLILFCSSASIAQEFLYPKKGQSKEQQDKDKYECHGWARTSSFAEACNPSATMRARRVSALTVELQLCRNVQRRAWA